MNASNQSEWHQATVSSGDGATLSVPGGTRIIPDRIVDLTGTSDAHKASLSNARRPVAGPLRKSALHRVTGRIAEKTIVDQDKLLPCSALPPPPPPPPRNRANLIPTSNALKQHEHHSVGGKRSVVSRGQIEVAVKRQHTTQADAENNWNTHGTPMVKQPEWDSAQDSTSMQGQKNRVERSMPSKQADNFVEGSISSERHHDERRCRDICSLTESEEVLAKGKSHSVDGTTDQGKQSGSIKKQVSSKHKRSGKRSSRSNDAGRDSTNHEDSQKWWVSHVNGSRIARGELSTQVKSHSLNGNAEHSEQSSSTKQKFANTSTEHYGLVDRYAQRYGNGGQMQLGEVSATHKSPGLDGQKDTDECSHSLKQTSDIANDTFSSCAHHDNSKWSSRDIGSWTHWGNESQTVGDKAETDHGEQSSSTKWNLVKLSTEDSHSDGHVDHHEQRHENCGEMKLRPVSAEHKSSDLDDKKDPDQCSHSFKHAVDISDDRFSSHTRHGNCKLSFCENGKWTDWGRVSQAVVDKDEADHSEQTTSTKQKLDKKSTERGRVDHHEQRYENGCQMKSGAASAKHNSSGLDDQKDTDECSHLFKQAEDIADDSFSSHTCHDNSKWSSRENGSWTDRRKVWQGVVDKAKADGGEQSTSTKQKFAKNSIERGRVYPHEERYENSGHVRWGTMPVKYKLPGLDGQKDSDECSHSFKRGDIADGGFSSHTCHDKSNWSSRENGSWTHWGKASQGAADKAEAGRGEEKSSTKQKLAKKWSQHSYSDGRVDNHEQRHENGGQVPWGEDWVKHWSPWLDGQKDTSESSHSFKQARDIVDACISSHTRHDNRKWSAHGTGDWTDWGKQSQVVADNTETDQGEESGSSKHKSPDWVNQKYRDECSASSEHENRAEDNLSRKNCCDNGKWSCRDTDTWVNCGQISWQCKPQGLDGKEDREDRTSFFKGEHDTWEGSCSSFAGSRKWLSDTWQGQKRKWVHVEDQQLQSDRSKANLATQQHTTTPNTEREICTTRDVVDRLPKDAPSSSAAHYKVTRIRGCYEFKLNQPGCKLKRVFVTFRSCGGNAEAAGRIARLCYWLLECGNSAKWVQKIKSSLITRHVQNIKKRLVKKVSAESPASKASSSERQLDYESSLETTSTPSALPASSLPMLEDSKEGAPELESDGEVSSEEEDDAIPDFEGDGGWIRNALTSGQKDSEDFFEDTVGDRFLATTDPYCQIASDAEQTREVTDGSTINDESHGQQKKFRGDASMTCDQLTSASETESA